MTQTMWSTLCYILYVTRCSDCCAQTDHHNIKQTTITSDIYIVFMFQGDKGWPGLPGLQGAPGPTVSI